MKERSGGPLSGLRMVEMVGIGPAPLAAMLLSDLGAEVIRIDRPQPADLGLARPVRFDLAARGRRSIAIDLKRPEGVECALALIEQADALIEGFRPGVMERLGLGPDVCLARNPRLVYGRMTGWGQEGPLAHTAGHDINYIALTGALEAIGRKGAPPTVPLNYLGDYAGGTMFLVLGLLAAILRARECGQGQVVDAAMIDGVSALSTPLIGLRAAGLYNHPRGENVLDGGAPFYDVYECADGKYVAVGAIEHKFRDLMLDKLGLREQMPDLDDRANWDEGRRLLSERFRQKTRDEWAALFDGSDACVTPVLTFEEAPDHPHHRARRRYVTLDGIVQPAPAPRFSGHAIAAERLQPPEAPGASSEAILRDWGVDAESTQRWLASGVIVSHT